MATLTASKGSQDIKSLKRQNMLPTTAHGLRCISETPVETTFRTAGRPSNVVKRHTPDPATENEHYRTIKPKGARAAISHPEEIPNCSTVESVWPPLQPDRSNSVRMSSRYYQ